MTFRVNTERQRVDEVRNLSSRKPRRRLAAVLLVMLTGCGGGNSVGSPSADSGLEQPNPTLPAPAGISTSVALGARRFVLYVPSSLGTGARPLVLMLHGFGATPEQTLTYDTLGRWNQLAERDAFIVAYPAAGNGAWAACGGGNADLGFFDDLLAVLGKAYSIDSRRVYAAGHSQGGQMALRLAVDRPATYAAVMANEAPTGRCGAGSKPVPVFLTYGTADPLVAYGGNAQPTLNDWLARNLSQLPPQVQQLPDGVVEDQSTIDESRYGAAAGGAEVLFWRMNGSGHAWPNPVAYPPSLQAQFGRRNQDVDGADAAWSFFRAHARQ